MRVLQHKLPPHLRLLLPLVADHQLPLPLTLLALPHLLPHLRLPHHYLPPPNNSHPLLHTHLLPLHHSLVLKQQPLPLLHPLPPPLRHLLPLPLPLLHPGKHRVWIHQSVLVAYLD